jgi:hypothetical protein
MNEGAKMALCDNEKRSQKVASFSLAINKREPEDRMYAEQDGKKATRWC